VCCCFFLNQLINLASYTRLISVGIAAICLFLGSKQDVVGACVLLLFADLQNKKL